jgi:hypothetical protein
MGDCPRDPRRLGKPINNSRRELSSPRLQYVIGDAVGQEQGLDGAFDFGQAQENMLIADVVVIERLGIAYSRFDDAPCFG